MNGAKIRKRRKEGKHAESNQGERKTGKYKGNIKKKNIIKSILLVFYRIWHLIYSEIIGWTFVLSSLKQKIFLARACRMIKCFVSFLK